MELTETSVLNDLVGAKAKHESVPWFLKNGSSRRVSSLAWWLAGRAKTGVEKKRACWSFGGEKKERREGRKKV